MNNTNAKLKLTFDSLDPGENPSKQRFRCEQSVLSMSSHTPSMAINIDCGALNILLVHGWKFIRKAIKFYEVFGGLNKYITSRDFLVLS